MSQHALKLAVALEWLGEAYCGAPDKMTAKDRLRHRLSLIKARETLTAYRSSDEYSEDVQRARASAAGFQGLAGDPSEKVTK